MTSTKTGLEVCVHINRKTYEAKIPVPQNFKDEIEKFCTFDEIIPKWNYLVKAT